MRVATIRIQSTASALFPLAHPAALVARSTHVRSQIGRWHLEKATAFRSHYDRVRMEIDETTSPQRAMELIRQIHEKDARDVIKDISEQEATLHNLGITRVLPPIGGPKSFSAAALPTRDTPRWKSEDVDPYYYHGTSLGIARVAALRGRLGGLAGLDHLLYVDRGTAVEGDTVYLTDTQAPGEYHLDPYSSVLVEILGYANRVTRPARAVMACLSMRAALESEQPVTHFPSVHDFSQRILIRFPKEDVPRVTGSRVFSQLGSRTPIPMARAEFLLEREIAFAKPALVFSGHLAAQDSERIDRFISMAPSNETLRDLSQAERQFMNAQELRRVAWANVSIGKWTPLNTVNPAPAGI